MMRRMCIEALYRRPNTSKPADGHKIYPYLLRGLAVERPNQVWAMDITYIPMARGFVYLAAVVDWFSRRVLAWRLSITMEVEFCLDAVDEALTKYGRPKIFNTDQGSQFTSTAFTGLLLENAIAISMDGRGSWRDNVFVERLWRSVKYEEVYLHAYDSVGQARASLGRYLDFYNCKRPHSSLAARTPDRAYFDPLPLLAAACVPPRLSGRRFGGTTPSLRDAPTTAYYNINRQRLYLSRAKHCLDEASHLSRAVNAPCVTLISALLPLIVRRWGSPAPAACRPSVPGPRRIRTRAYRSKD